MLTTSQKITAAFTISIAIMATLAFIGYRGLTEAGDAYKNANRLSSIDTAVSNTLRFLNNTAYLSTVFLRTGDSNDINQGLESLERAQKILSGAAKLTATPSLIKDLEEVQDGILQFEQNLKNLREHRTNALVIYKNAMEPSLRAFEQQIDVIVEIEYEAQNLDFLNEIAHIWPVFSVTDSTLTRYMETQTFDDGDALDAALIKLGTLVQGLEENLFTPESVLAYEELKKIYQTMYAAYYTLYPLIVASRTSNENREISLNNAVRMATEFNEAFTELRQRRNLNAETESNDTQTQTMTIAIVGLLITIAFAAFIILSITSTFKKLSTYFIHIANGDFNAHSGITEKGAIGIMVEGMQQIPDTLNKIIKESNEVALDVMNGHFRNRFNSAAYSGGFSTLGDSINSLANTYTAILDTIPIPTMVANLDCKIVFLNAAAQGVAGGNKEQELCGNILNTPECNTSNCFGKKCISTKQPMTGITSSGAGGRSMDLNVQTAPLFDQKGKVIAFIETITDISEVKNQQRLIMKTASEAAEIADRVASATEELSAQVEQTTLGTNEQKRQVESTASAMHEMNSTVLEVARNAGQTASQTETTLQKAHNGAQLVDKVVHSINAVNSVANTLQSNMQELGIQADNIGSVMNTISDIADQTNLLALNAAIEAARAGDAGRGFAVVADEVRKLAEKTMNATHDVGTSISTIQSSIRSNISEVANAVESVAQATDLANSSGQALSEIVELVTSNTQLVSSIATGAEQQSATSDEINRALSEINMVVNEVSSNMMQSSQAVGELSNMAQELRNLMKKLG